ncbi:hypothetical protein Htur_5271 (plasmid) [Haloterrigena turkmenica DSM 5511]|uniref:Uncharacterized protein n=1 Tax=Haloterrigena turkmenica (strain ATCC 51198 / DSM 5511 / JCM 9101 / NCIMB 13204 / VKM B-1734 / 4k) TaxID=543526 RepID=D2S3Q2_HALTV|nr:hypothetical protein Htur_5271 [Haloterrigena turkmenica DSM 5511]
MREHFVGFAHALLTQSEGATEISDGPLHAVKEDDVWSVWFLRDDDQPLYLDTVRPPLWPSAAELNAHLQQLAPLEPGDDVDENKERADSAHTRVPVILIPYSPCTNPWGYASRPPVHS